MGKPQANTPPDQQPALFGYEGQPPEVTLKSGIILSAGELVGQAYLDYLDANGGENVNGTTWNELADGERRRHCLNAIAHLDATSEATAADVDTQAALSGTVAKVADKLLGEALINAALTEVKALERPWQQMTEDQQRDVLERITKQTREAVRDTIRLLATNGAPHLVCDLEQITVKKGAKAVLSIPKGELDQDLLDAVGQQVILVIGPELKAAADIAAPRPDPSQGELIVAADLGNGDDGLVTHSDPAD